MNIKTRILERGYCIVTQDYNPNHNGIDIVGENYGLDSIVAHSDGIVMEVIDNIIDNTPNEKNNPGNMILIKHNNGYQTRYLHLAFNSIKVRVGDEVRQGQIIGYMGDTGYSFGKHLHFEVIKNNIKINPIHFINNDLPINANINVFYRVKTKKHGWLPEVKNLTDYAGYENSPITDIAIKVDKGKIKYRIHNKNGNWLPYVTGYDINNSINGYAGNGKIIDAIEIYYFTPNDIEPIKKAKYKVNEYPWQYDNEKTNGQDGYAGVFGIDITKIQIVIE